MSTFRNKFTFFSSVIQLYTINVPLELKHWIILNLRGEIIQLFTDKGTFIVLSHSSLHRSKCFILVFRQSIIEGERDVKELKCETCF